MCLKLTEIAFTSPLMLGPGPFILSFPIHKQLARTLAFVGIKVQIIIGFIGNNYCV